VARADAVDDECRRLEHVIEGESERYRRDAERLARPARVCAFSSAARDTLTRLEQLGRSEALLALIIPPGCDPVAWAAHFHLSGPRAGGPFIVVDATSAGDVSPEHFEDPKRSALALADGGTLLVTALLALPLETQDVFAIALSQRQAYAPRSSVLPPAVVLALPQPLDTLIKSGGLSSNLSRWFRDAEVRVPSLAERPEDLRALALDALARKCLERGRQPLGLDPGALRWILEHPFADNEAELRSVLGRAIVHARGTALTESDLEGNGGSPGSAWPPKEPTAAPSPSRRRASRRPPRSR
jgi:two-component system response regulator PilR (NtrC family)